MNHAAELPHLEELPPLDATDAACLADLHAILARHGKEARFGVGLLHRHWGPMSGWLRQLTRSLVR